MIVNQFIIFTLQAVVWPIFLMYTIVGFRFGHDGRWSEDGKAVTSRYEKIALPISIIITGVVFSICRSFDYNLNENSNTMALSGIILILFCLVCDIIIARD